MAGDSLSYGATYLADSTFTSNTSWNDGGGAWVRGPLTLTGGLFQSNQTLLNESNGGGGGLMSFGYTSISGTCFVSNTTADWGGGAYIYYIPGNSANLVSLTEFTNNTATSGGGGGLFTWYTTTLTAPSPAIMPDTAAAACTPVTLATGSRQSTAASSAGTPPSAAAASYLRRRGPPGWRTCCGSEHRPARATAAASGRLSPPDVVDGLFQEAATVLANGNGGGLEPPRFDLAHGHRLHG